MIQPSLLGTSLNDSPQKSSSSALNKTHLSGSSQLTKKHISAQVRIRLATYFRESIITRLNHICLFLMHGCINPKQKKNNKKIFKRKHHIKSLNAINNCALGTTEVKNLVTKEKITGLLTIFYCDTQHGTGQSSTDSN